MCLRGRAFLPSSTVLGEPPDSELPCVGEGCLGAGERDTAVPAVLVNREASEASTVERIVPSRAFLARAAAALRRSAERTGRRSQRSSESSGRDPFAAAPLVTRFLDDGVDERADHAIARRNLGGEAMSDTDGAIERPPEWVAEQLFDLGEGQLFGKEVGEIAVEGTGNRARWGGGLERSPRRGLSRRRTVSRSRPRAVWKPGGRPRHRPAQHRRLSRRIARDTTQRCPRPGGRGRDEVTSPRRECGRGRSRSRWRPWRSPRSAAAWRRRSRSAAVEI